MLRRRHGIQIPRAFARAVVPGLAVRGGRRTRLALLGEDGAEVVLGKPAPREAISSFDRPLLAYGRVFLVKAGALPAFYDSYPADPGLQVLLFGLVLTGLVAGHSPESRFLQAYSVSELHNSPLTFGLAAAPRELRRQAAADFAARHSDGNSNGGGAGAAAAGSPPSPSSSSPPPSGKHPPAVAVSAALFPVPKNGHN